MNRSHRSNILRKKFVAEKSDHKEGLLRYCQKKDIFERKFELLRTFAEQQQFSEKKRNSRRDKHFVFTVPFILRNTEPLADKYLYFFRVIMICSTVFLYSRPFTRDFRFF
jgi:hypothetical protein